MPTTQVAGRGPFAQRRRVALIIAVAAAALAAAALPIPARAGQLHVAIEDPTCPRRLAIAREIEQRAAPLMTAQPDLVLIIRMLEPGELSLRLIGPQAGTTLQRSIPFSRADCDALANAVTVFLRSWVTREWSERPAPSDLGPPPAEAGAARYPVAAGSEPAEGGPPNPPGGRDVASPWSLTAGAGASAGLDLSRPGASATLGVETGLNSRLGLGMSARYEGGIEAGFPAGDIDARLVTVAATIRVRALAKAALEVDLLTGPALGFLYASALDFPQGQARLLIRPGWVASARLSAPLVRRVRWLASLDVVARASADRLLVHGMNRTSGLWLHPIRVGLNAGVAWDGP